MNKNPITILTERKEKTKKKKGKRKRDYSDPHLGCPSYPNCDIDPNGCIVLMGDDVEWYGHRD